MRIIKSIGQLICLSCIVIACSNQPNYGNLENSNLSGVDSSSISSDTSTFSLPHIFNSVDTNKIVKILKTGTYHNDEVWANAENGIWFGLFQNKAGFVIEKIEISAELVHDVIVDGDESIKTGWQISTKNVNTNLLLMQGIELKEGLLKHVHIPNANLLPGDSLVFEYGSTSYKLFATGTSIFDYEISESPFVENYGLFLTGVKNGQEITQLLVEHQSFDDAMVSILFIGDIDGDGFPDLILDNAQHYNVTNPTLYLSKGVSKNKMLQIVGWHWSVGC